MKYCINFLFLIFLFGCGIMPLQKSENQNLDKAHPDDSFDTDKWITFYYTNPEPDKIIPALKELHDKEMLLLPNSREPLAAFFGIVLKNNPAVTSNIVNTCSFLTNKEFSVLAYALWLANTEEADSQLAQIASRNPKLKKLLSKSPPALLSTEVSNPAVLDSCWASFYASGNMEYVDKVIDCLENAKSQTILETKIYKAARWSLEKNCLLHKKILDHCRKIVKNKTGLIKDELNAIIFSAQKQDQKKNQSQRKK